MGLNSIFGPLFVSIVFLFVFILLLFSFCFFLRVYVYYVFLIQRENVFRSYLLDCLHVMIMIMTITTIITEQSDYIIQILWPINTATHC